MYKPPATALRKWTASAIYCYKIGCNCSKCYIPDIMETHCMMKFCVIELVKKFGKPKFNKVKGIINERF